MANKVQMYDGPCTFCGESLGDWHLAGCVYAAERKVGISGHAALRKVTGRQQPLRTVEDKITRLRERVKQTKADPGVTGVLLGILDLLGDEL
jgi:hypothetical protein